MNNPAVVNGDKALITLREVSKMYRKGQRASERSMQLT